MKQMSTAGNIVLLRKVYAPHNVGVFQTFCVCTNYSLQSNSLHEMALLPKQSIIYTPPWEFLESGAQF